MFLPKTKQIAIIKSEILRFIIIRVRITPDTRVRLGDFQEIIYYA